MLNIRDIVVVCLVFKLIFVSWFNILWVLINLRYFKGGFLLFMWCWMKNFLVFFFFFVDILVLFSFCMLGSFVIRSCCLCWLVYWYSSGIFIILIFVNMGKDLSVLMVFYVFSRVLFRFNVFRFGNCWGIFFGEMFFRGYLDICNFISFGKMNLIFLIFFYCVMVCLLIDKFLMFGYCFG